MVTLACDLRMINRSTRRFYVTVSAFNSSEKLSLHVIKCSLQTKILPGISSSPVLKVNGV